MLEQQALAWAPALGALFREATEGGVDRVGTYGGSVPLEGTVATVGTFLFPQVWNTSLELLPLWLVSGSYAYSLKAACPLGKT